MKIFNIIIEPLEERYSIQWAKWWQNEFRNQHIESIIIKGDVLTSKVETGSFLDCHGTIYWKSEQLKTISQYLKDKIIKDGDVLFFHDLWFPGIEGLAYIRDISGVDFKIAGYLHAGSYDPADLLSQLNMQRWVRGCEVSWLRLIDYVFVGSYYHKQLLIDICPLATNKIFPIGYPVLKEDFFIESIKQKVVVFPHRLNIEKHPDLFDLLACKLKDEAVFVKTKDVCKTKNEYYRLLAKAKVSVSFAEQETFGIAMVESALMGCIPITPNKLSYIDTMPSEWQYDSFNKCIELVRKALNTENYVYHKELDYHPSTIVAKVLKEIAA